jgi:uncharacterized protein (TIGR03437 family)
MRGIRVLCVLAAAAGIAAAQPTVASVANAASNILTGLPNSGLAQGSIAVAYGRNLGPEKMVVASKLPWPRELAGTSAQITVGGQNYDLPIYYTVASQIAFLVPSSVPTGGGTIRVTYNGKTSATAPAPIAFRNLGIFTLNSRGTGPAIITYPDYTFVSQSKAADCGAPLTFCGAANPGQTLILWGTGLGPVPFAGDETTTPLPGDLPDVPLSVWIGGVSANVTYRGRSGCCIAEDQIAFVVPDNISGCSVPIAVQIGGAVSNYATIAIAPSGKTCIPFAAGVPEGGIQQLAAKDSPAIGYINLDRALSDQGNSDRGEAGFFRVKAPGSTVAAAIDERPIDTCTVRQYFNASGPGGDDPLDLLPLAVLDAGTSIAVTSSGRNRMLLKTEEGGYAAKLGDATAGNYLDPGVYTVTGTGGADIGGFTAAVTVPPPLVWTNPPANNTLVARANGMTVNWTGGDPKGTVSISGGGQVNSNSPGAPPRAGVVFNCRVRAAPGTFVIPRAVLGTLPAYNPNNPGAVYGYVGLAGFSAPTILTAPGLDASVVQSIFEGGSTQVRFQ